MTDIDQALGRHFFERLLAQLSLIWNDVAGLDLSLDDGRPAHGDRADGRRCPSRRSSIMMEARLGGMLRDAGAADPVVGDRAGGRPVRRPRGRHAPAAREDDARRVRRAVGDVEMTRARRGRRRSTMPIEDVLALKPGDLLRLKRPPSAGITLYADKVPVHRARPGRSGSRRAVQVTGTCRRFAMSADRRPQTGSASRPPRPCLGVLEMFAAGQGLGRRGRRRRGDAKAAFDGVPVPAVAMSVSYVDGVTGGNVFLSRSTARAARRRR